jgi:outer membrane protein TolC
LSQDWRQLLPTLDLRAQYGSYQSYFGTVTAWTGSIGITVPLFDRLQNYSRAKEQSYNRTKSESRLEQVQRNAKADWEASHANFKRALDSALRRDETLILSRKIYSDNLRRFHAGRITANDLVVDQNRMYEAELLAIQGWGSVHLSYSRLCHALGDEVKNCMSSKQ